MCVYKYVYIHIHKDIYIQMYMYVHIYICIIHIYSCIYQYTDIYIHIIIYWYTLNKYFRVYTHDLLSSHAIHVAWIRAKHFMPRPWLCQGMPRTRNMKPRRSRAVVFGFTPLTMATAVAVVNTQWDMFTCKKNSSKSLYFQAHRLRPKLFRVQFLSHRTAKLTWTCPSPNNDRGSHRRSVHHLLLEVYHFLTDFFDFPSHDLGETRNGANPQNLLRYTNLVTHIGLSHWMHKKTESSWLQHGSLRAWMY